MKTLMISSKLSYCLLVIFICFLASNVGSSNLKRANFLEIEKIAKKDPFQPDNLENMIITGNKLANPDQVEVKSGWYNPYFANLGYGDFNLQEGVRLIHKLDPMNHVPTKEELKNNKEKKKPVIQRKIKTQPDKKKTESTTKSEGFLRNNKVSGSLEF